MDVLSYLSRDGKQRILLTGQVALINGLIRQSGVNARGVKITSLSSLAKEIVSYHFGKQGKQIQFLDSSFAYVFFERTVKENLEMFPYFQGHRDLLDHATMKELFRIVNVVRLGNVDHNGLAEYICSEEDKHRIKDVFQICEVYVRKLKSANLLDPTEILVQAFQEGKTWKWNEMALPSISDIDFDTQEYTYIEKEFVSLLKKVTKSEVESLTYPSYFYDFVNNQKSNRELSFFRGFGSVNEVKYCLYDMLKNEFPFGSVSLQYVSQSDITTIQAEFDKCGVPYCFTDGTSALMNPVIQWILALLKWARNQYEEKYLEPILDVTFLTQRIDENLYLNPGNLLKLIVGGSYSIYDDGPIHRVEYRLGWSYERYLKLIEILQKCSINPNYDVSVQKQYQFYASLIRELIFIFHSPCTLTGVFQAIIAFLEKYYTGDPMDYLNIKSGLDSLLAYYEFMNDDSMSLEEISNQIQEDLENLLITQTLQSNVVEIQRLNRFHMLEREHTYVIGMSAVNMKNTAAQSPILSDEELKYFIKDSYLPISSNTGIRNIQKIKMTLSTNPMTSLSLGYNFFDTQEESECNPSVIYLDLQSLDPKADHEIFEYGLPKEMVFAISKPHEVSKKQRNEFLFASYPKYSASTLEVLSDCPRWFYYRYIKNLEPLEFMEPKPFSWLDHRSRGNFLHSVLEEYTRSVFENSSQVPFNSDVLNQVMIQTAQKYKEELPTVEEWIMNREIDQIHQQAEQYLKELHDDYENSGWSFLFSEQKFKDACLHDAIEISINGKIDRLDYRIDHERKCIEIRTIDYKTGNVDRVTKKITNGIAQQRRVYTAALQQEEIQNKIKQRLHKLHREVNLIEYQITEAGFYYVFVGQMDVNEETGNSHTSIRAILRSEDDEASAYRLSSMIQACINAGEFLDRFTIGERMEENYTYDESSPKEGVIASLRGPMGKRGNKRNKCDTKCYCKFAHLCHAYKG